MRRWASALVGLALGCESIVGIEDRRFEEEEATSECRTYCDAVMEGCTGGIAAYPDRATCLSTCGALPSGESKSDNSLECRSEQAVLAGSSGEPASHCKAAGPFGAGICGSTCQGYCTLLSAACPDKLTGIGDCVAACGGLRADGSYDLSTLSSGDNVECRVAHASLATRDPEKHCPDAAFKSAACADPPAAEPSCDDYCKLVGVACTGASSAYESPAQCLAVCKLLDPGKNADKVENSVGCRKYHAYNAIAAPAQHCAHAGPSGDGHCGKDNCEGYCQLVERACAAEFKATLGDLGKCASACGKWPGAAADSWNATAETGNTVRCRVINAARASEKPSACAAAVGGGECQ